METVRERIYRGQHARKLSAGTRKALTNRPGGGRGGAGPGGVTRDGTQSGGMVAASIAAKIGEPFQYRGLCESKGPDETKNERSRSR